MAKDSRKRSFYKAVSWRVIAMLITMATSWYITGSLDFAITIGLLDTVIKIVSYYAHERVWTHFPDGKNPVLSI